MKNYIVATIKPWNIVAFNQVVKRLPGNWFLFTDPQDLTKEAIQKIAPRYIFFPHWSWKVSSEILEHAECICFHSSDLPYGRGGSPIQNLILEGYTETKLTALRMTNELDAGPIYMKLPIDLTGNAQTIFETIASHVFDMIAEIVAKEPEPVPQVGQVKVFKRRAPEQSQIPINLPLTKLYDHIRMLDADTYPRAFIDYGEIRFEFTNAVLGQDKVEAQVVITRHNKNTNEK
jgi:methionyl-tRNA formyltransferase